MIDDIVQKALQAYRSQRSYDVGVNESDVLAVFHDDGCPKFWIVRDDMCRPDLGIFTSVGARFATNAGYQLNCWHLVEDMNWL